MSVKAILIIDDIEVNVLSFDFAYNKQADISGRPTSKSIFNGLSIAIESREQLNLADWAIAQDETKQIELHIYPRFLDSKTRKITLYDCHLLKWDNYFSASGNEPLTEFLQISCGGVKDSNSSIQYEAYWRKTYDSEAEPTVLSHNEEEEIHVINCSYTDREGNPITELYEGEEITLIVTTENCVGKPIDIDLSEFEFEFKYQGNVVPNNILENIKVTANEHRIDLEVIEKED